MRLPGLIAILASGLLGACSSLSTAPDASSAKAHVQAAERAFAHTMADRNHAQFASFISDEAVFFGGPSPLRGKAAVVQAWVRYFVAPTAPFTWEPDEVEVLAPGGARNLAHRL